MDYKGEIVKGHVEETGVLHLILSRAPVNSAGESFFYEVGHYFEVAKVGAAYCSRISLT